MTDSSNTSGQTCSNCGAEMEANVTDLGRTWWECPECGNEQGGN